MKRKQSKSKNAEQQQQQPAPSKDPFDPRQKRGPEKKTNGGSQCDSEKDCVEEASEESFPASDAPSWTPTKGT